METTKQWGGKREGAGRKKTSVKTYCIYAPQDVFDIMEAVEGNKSEYILNAIRAYHAAHQAWPLTFHNIRKRRSKKLWATLVFIPENR